MEGQTDRETKKSDIIPLAYQFELTFINHQEQHEFNGSQVTVERFPAEPVHTPYAPPTPQPALPPFAPAQQPAKQYKGLLGLFILMLDA